MTIQIQEIVIRWILSPLSKLITPVGPRTRSIIISLCVFFNILSQFVYRSGILPLRYLIYFTLFCLFFGIILLMGLTPALKPVFFSKPLLLFWYGTAIFMLLSGILVDSNYLADFMLWFVAIPLFWCVWNNRGGFSFIRPFVSGVYLSFLGCIIVLILFFPINTTQYKGFFGNPNSLSMYCVAVCACAYGDILSFDRFSRRMIPALLCFGGAITLTVYSNSRGGQLAIILCCISSSALYFFVKRTQWKRVLLHQIFPAILSIIVLLPTTVTLFQSGYALLYPDSDASTELTFDNISNFNKKRYADRTLINEEGSLNLDGFTTGRAELWLVYLREVGFRGNPLDNELYDSKGQVENKSSHFTLIQMAYEYGALAAVFFLAFNIFSGLKSIKLVYKRAGTGWSMFPFIISIAYGTLYLVEVISSPVANILCFLYYTAQTPLLAELDCAPFSRDIDRI